MYSTISRWTELVYKDISWVLPESWKLYLWSARIQHIIQHGIVIHTAHLRRPPFLSGPKNSCAPQNRVTSQPDLWLFPVRQETRRLLDWKITPLLKKGIYNSSVIVPAVSVNVPQITLLAHCLRRIYHYFNKKLEFLVSTLWTVLAHIITLYRLIVSMKRQEFTTSQVLLYSAQ